MSINPHPLFETEWYLERNPDVAEAGVNALQHFLSHGWREGRDPHPLFYTNWYLEHNPDVAQAGINPLIHFLEFGAAEGRDPTPLFDADWYLRQNRDVKEAGLAAFIHYRTDGWREGRNPHPHFNVPYYRAQNPDVSEVDVDPLQHYCDSGWKEGRNPNPNFDSEWYAKQYNVRNGLNPLAHYLMRGVKQGLQIQPPAKKSSFRLRSLQAERAAAETNWVAALKEWENVLSDKQADESTLGRAKTNVSILKRLCNLGEYRQAITKYKNLRFKKISTLGQSIPRVVIYSAIVGDYDLVKLPEVLDERLEYILFTDQENSGAGVWDTRPINIDLQANNRRARYIKTHPHRLLDGADIAVWMDANFMIVGDIYRLVEQFIASNKAVGAIPHPVRDDIYQELDACIKYGKESEPVMRQQVERYRSAGFEHSDLIESGLMMFNLNDSQTGLFLDSWWNEIEQHSTRDQLSLNYCLAKHKIDWHRLMHRPQSARNHPAIAFGSHGKHDDGLSRHLISALEGQDKQHTKKSIAKRAPAIQFTPSQTGNPYYTLIPEALRQLGRDITYATDWNAVRAAGEDGPLVLHLHQLEPYYHSSNFASTKAAAEILLSRLEDCAKIGVRIVLTWHNPYPHDRRYLEIDHWLYERLNPVLSGVVIHLESCRPFVEHFVDRSKIHVVPHPSLNSHYGKPYDRRNARSALGIPFDTFLAVSIGAIKPYKGLETLATAWDQLGRNDALLFIGGQSSSPDLLARLTNLRSSRVSSTFLNDDDVRMWMSAADVAVFAHKSIWTSGSAILAMSYGLPVIMPDSAHTRGYIRPENNGLLYQAGDPSALSLALQAAMGGGMSEHIRASNEHFARTFTPTFSAKLISKIYDAIS